MSPPSIYSCSDIDFAVLHFCSFDDSIISFKPLFNSIHYPVTTVEEAEALLASASKFAIWLCACPYQLKNLPAVRQLRNIIMEKKYGAVKSLEVLSKLHIALNSHSIRLSFLI